MLYVISDNIEIDTAFFKWAVNNNTKVLPTKIVYFSSLPKTWIKDAGENMAKLANQHHGVDIRVYRCAPYTAQMSIFPLH